MYDRSWDGLMFQYLTYIHTCIIIVTSINVNLFLLAPIIIFILQADCPDPVKIPCEDLLGVTVVLLTCSYKKQEFVRVGYYVNNEYPDQEMADNPPAKPVHEKVQFNNVLTVSALSVLHPAVTFSAELVLV